MSLRCYAVFLCPIDPYHCAGRRKLVDGGGKRSFVVAFYGVGVYPEMDVDQLLDDGGVIKYDT